MKKVIPLVFLLFTSACAWTEEAVHVGRPSVSVSPVPGAMNVSVTVTGSDLRAEQEVSHKKNGYGMRGSNINASNNLTEEVRAGVLEILTAQGFRAGSDVAITVALNRLYSNFDMGFFSATANAQAIATLTANAPDGRVLYTRSYTANHQETGVQIMTGDNAALALRGALGALMRQIADDAQLTRALLAAASQPTAPALGGAPARRRVGA